MDVIKLVLDALIVICFTVMLNYDNVTVCSTCENQEMADYRLPIFLSVPIKHKEIIHEPMLEAIDINKYLESGQI